MPRESGRTPDETRTARAAPRGRPLRNLLALSMLAVWAACAWVLVGEPRPMFRAAAILLSGGMLTGLDLVLHEAAHGVLLRNRRANRWVGFLAGVPGLVSVTAYRAYHLRHHAQPLAVSAREWLTNGTPLYLLSVPWAAWRGGDRRRRRDVAVEYGAIACAATALWIAAARGGFVHVLVDVWLLPLAVSVGLNAFRGWTETLASAAVRYEGRRGHAFVSERWMRLMSDHLEHHLHPSLPWHALGEERPRLRSDRMRDRPEWSYLRYLWERLERRAGAAPAGGRR